MTIASLSGQVAARSIALAQMYAQAITTGTMNSTVEIRRPAAGGFDDTTREYQPPVAPLIYPEGDAIGIAGITPAEGSTEVDLGGEPTYYSSVMIKLPMETPRIRIDDVVKVITSPDSGIMSRFFRVVDVPAGGRIVTGVNLRAVGISPSKQWS